MENKTIIIENKETAYLIFDDGRLFNKKTNHFLKGSITATGYRRYQLTIKGKAYNFLAHRLVAEYFLKNDNNLEIVHHKDGNKLNNYKNNLEWVTSSENLKETYIMGRENNQTVFKISKEELEQYTWRQIDDTQYWISENGIVYNKNTRRKLKQKKDGYFRVTYYKDKKAITESVHRLVYRIFSEKEIIGQIDHIDGNKFNNSFNNLRDITNVENMKNAMDNGHKNLIPVVQLDDNLNIINTFPSIAAAAKHCNCQPSLIRRAINNGNKTHNYYWKKK